MQRHIQSLLLIPLLLSSLPAGAAEELSGKDLRSLDGQVQEIKSDVLDIASELANLEERLLYPSNTQVSVFVALAAREDFRLDAVKVEIDGTLASHHIYSFQELDALRKGGVQRIYTGNVVTGDHQLTVTMQGKRPNGEDFSTVDSFSFAKGIEPKTLGVTLGDPGSGRSGIEVGAW